MSRSTTASSGILGLLGHWVSLSHWLGVVFIVLRLVEVIDWSWWWVLAPFWIPWALLGVVATGAGAIWVVVGVARGLSTWWRLRKMYKEEI